MRDNGKHLQSTRLLAGQSSHHDVGVQSSAARGGARQGLGRTQSFLAVITLGQCADLTSHICIVQARPTLSPSLSGYDRVVMLGRPPCQVSTKPGQGKN